MKKGFGEYFEVGLKAAVGSRSYPGYADGLNLRHHESPEGHNCWLPSLYGHRLGYSMLKMGGDAQFLCFHWVLVQGACYLRVETVCRVDKKVVGFDVASQ